VEKEHRWTAAAEDGMNHRARGLYFLDAKARKPFCIRFRGLRLSLPRDAHGKTCADEGRSPQQIAAREALVVVCVAGFVG
jgi:hypothetical protein